MNSFLKRSQVEKLCRILGLNLNFRETMFSRKIYPMKYLGYSYTKNYSVSSKY
jgi:hypothetical protein